MPIVKFGRCEKTNNGNGVSLSYIIKIFQLKDEIPNALKTVIDENHVLQKRVEGIEKFIQETVIPKLIASPKHLITMWAEARRSLEAGKFEWSFGDSNRNSGNIGYTMLSSGKILRMGLSVGGEGQDDAGVQLVVNGETFGSYQVYKGHGQRSAVEVFNTPFPVNQGDVINFRSLLTSDRNVKGGIVNLLIELDL